MRIYLSLPSYDERYWGNTWMSVLHCGIVPAETESRQDELCVEPISGSLLPRVFNEALARAVVRGYDLLCMLHADISAEPGWLTTVLAEMTAHKADVLSAVIPRKDERRLSSTGISTAAEAYRTLSLEECSLLPRTFDISEPYLQRLGATTLLVNTGLLLMDLHGVWLRKWHGFQIRSRIVWGEHDTATVDTVGEDWDMSEQLAGIEPRPKVMATTSVWCHHRGAKVWSSKQP